MTQFWTWEDFAKEMDHLQKLSSIRPDSPCVAAMRQTFCAKLAVVTTCTSEAIVKLLAGASLLHIIEESLATFHKAFPSVGMIRKWHWMLHLPDSLARYGQLPNCFACERKHKAISALATKLKRTMAYEHHMMEQVLATEITMLREPGQFTEGTQIVQPKQANSKQIAALSQFISTPCPEAKVSSVARLERGGYCHAQDAIVYADGGSWKVAQVQFHVILHEMHCTFVQPWCLQKCHFEKQCAKFKPSDLQGLILLQSILYPVVFCKDKDEATVLLPFQIYSQR